MDRSSSMSSTTMQSLTFITFIVSEKIAMIKLFLPHPIIPPAGLTLIITLTHIFHLSQKRESMLTYICQRSAPHCLSSRWPVALGSPLLCTPAQQLSWGQLQCLPACWWRWGLPLQDRKRENVKHVKQTACTYWVVRKKENTCKTFFFMPFFFFSSPMQTEALTGRVLFSMNVKMYFTNSGKWKIQYILL